jgi:predicted O-methyltransferase YrrM
VRSSLEKDRLDKNVDLHLCPDGSDEQARNSYVNVIEGLKPSSLDYCLIDGVSRGHCALAAIPKLKPGGLMIVDNVNWYVPRNPPSQAPNSITSGSDEFTTEWKLFQRITADWRCIWTSNGVWDTAFWFKPVSSQD